MRGGYPRVSDASLPVRGAWIEIMILRFSLMIGWSLPVRGAWIEMLNKAEQKALDQGRSP